MRAKIGEVFGRTGARGTDDYDFGSTTRLAIERAGGRDGRIGRQSVRLLVRVAWCGGPRRGHAGTFCTVARCRSSSRLFSGFANAMTLAAKDFANCLGGNPVDRTWLGGSDSLALLWQNPTNTLDFSVTRTRSAIYRSRILSSAFIGSRLFSGFANAMTLEMTLTAKDFANCLRREFPECPSALARIDPGLLAQMDHR